MSLNQMGLGKRAGLAILCVLILVGCASQSKITQAYNVLNGVRDVRNDLLLPAYDIAYAAHPEWKDQIAAFDLEFHDALEAAYQSLALTKAGTGTWSDYQAKLSILAEIITKYKIEEKIPELKKPIDLIKALLGVQ